MCVCVRETDQMMRTHKKRERSRKRQSQKPETEIERGSGREGEEYAGKNL